MKPGAVPKDQIFVRTSERLTLTQCPQKWDWSYNDLLRPRTSSPALRFGTLIHTAMEKFYRPGLKRGPHPAKTFEKEYAKELKEQIAIGFRDEDDVWHDAASLGVAMLEAYIDKFGDDEQWEVISTERAFHTPVFDPKTGLYLFTYVGVMDGVWRNRSDRRMWIVDHKTTKDDPTKKTDALILDEQAGAYWTFGLDSIYAHGTLKPKQKLAGMLYNFLRKGKPDERKTNALGQSLNLDGSVSKKQPTPLFHREPVFRDKKDGETVRKRAIAQFRMMQAYRDGSIEVTKTPGTLHNPHCKWCDFRDMCELHESQQDWESFAEATMGTWDPFAQHEIYEGR